MMGVNDGFEGVGNRKSTAVEDREHQPLILAKRVTDIPSDLQQRIDYGSRTDGQPVYIGYGARSLASDATGWIIHKFTYTDNLMTLRQTAIHSWDDRINGSYA